MKKFDYLFMLLVIIAVFASCGKDGAVGPQGSTGSTGAQGSQGAVGPAGPAGANGQNGSVIYSGITAPPATTGVKGDFYLNSSNGLLYGPKTDAGWGTGFSLVGPAGATGAIGATGAQGATGAAGNSVLSGTGVPSAALGKTGDFYLDKSSYLLYGPKALAGWGPAASLQGPAGTANVEYSGWNYATNFRDTTADASSLHAADLVAPKLTQSILDNGQVQVYFTFGGGVYTLPYTSNAGGKLSIMSYLPRLGHFIITRFTADNTNSVALSTLLQYRYIIIPGGVHVATINHVDLNDYEAVRKYYRIKD
ncbi:MAG: hypothetical protein JWR50_2114 [Mucilaginibacter sp.]|nr:hypothetical protein [Mucilaginibacter sp.]